MCQASPARADPHIHTLTHTQHTMHTHTHTHSLEKMESKRHPHGQPLADLFFGSWQQVLSLLAFSLLSLLSLLAAARRLVLCFVAVGTQFT